jgi:hypothetical protein
MPEMDESATYGRYPNGTGAFIRMLPTYAAENGFTALTLEEESIEMDVLLFPNPAHDVVTIQFLANTKESVEVYDLQGQLIYKNQLVSNSLLTISDWEQGLYLVVFPNLGISQKLIKQ